ncbi:MAG: hypothetical protein ISN64_03805 [Rickettsia sp.]|nr:hypothetical protein [Rickettsia sp.]
MTKTSSTKFLLVMTKFSKLKLKDFSKNEEKEISPNNEYYVSNTNSVTTKNFIEQNNIKNTKSDLNSKQEEEEEIKKRILDVQKITAEASYKKGIADTKNRFRNLLQYLKNYKKNIDIDTKLEKQFYNFVYNFTDFKKNYMDFAKNSLELILNQILVEISFDIEKFFIVLEKEMDIFYSQGTILLKVNPDNYENFKKFFLKSTIYNKYKNILLIESDNNITFQTCSILYKDLSLYFDDFKLKSLLKNIVKS